MNNPINNTVFDSRDLIEYKESLEQDLVDSFNDYISEFDEEKSVSSFDEITFTEGFEYRFQNEIDHYNDIKNFIDELDGSSDFGYGIGIIHENYWEEYCQELVTDCGFISKDFPSWIEIDWESTADNISADYMTATYENDTYYIRA